ncbi:AAA family ATPase [Microbacterium sp. JZ31]|uniref:AAA family ATPase n=1 Tax=Microbacterium sp. JZ31 TaxID=1906274 RepID=UPI0019345FA4|nr:AAA family ATPase [Microbacterium sp. JZ31]
MTDEQFLADLHRLVRRINEMPDTREAQPTPLGHAVEAFLGRDPEELPVTRDSFAAHRLADVGIALQTLVAEDPRGHVVGVAGGQEKQHEDLPGLLRHRYSTFAPGPVEYATVATGPDESRQAVAFGLHLLHHADAPAAVLLRAPAPMFGREEVALEVLARDADAGSTLLAEIRRRANEHSVIRGKVVSFTPDEFGHRFGGLSFLQRPTVPAESVVLPDGMLERIRAHVVDIGAHADELLRHGQHLKRGVLLYGPPGTGKTLTVQHLTSVTAGRTAILLQGGGLAYVAEAARLARAMSPSLLVFEDVDLVATERGMFGGPQPLLFEILDALDGVGGDADIAFVMTTNRADLLEPALASRPGRADLAVEVPLPDAAARRRLFRLYGGSTPLSAQALDAAADRAEGVTASFAKELIRRALLRAILDGREASDADLDAALDEMLEAGARLTRSLLGSAGEAPPADDEPESAGATFGWTR